MGVTNHFKLPGSPFQYSADAEEALKVHVMEHANLTRTDVDKYTSWELATLAQFDLYKSQEPLPAENVLGLARQVAMVRLVSGKNRSDPEKKAFAQSELFDLLMQPCLQAS